MSSREDILESIRSHIRMRYEKPDYAPLEQEALTYTDKVAQFCSVMQLVGGKAVVLGEGEDINEVITRLYPDAGRIATCVDEVKGQAITCATFRPDDVSNPGELDGTDLAIVQGRVGVCENGAVWVQQDVEQRAVYFISEALVLLVDKSRLVNNMHEAYKCIDTGSYGYGVFISGPSKTADIEQALVMGAHGARDVTVILI